MILTIRSQVALAAVLSISSAMCFAQSAGEATYTAKCKMCHGATGAGDTPTGKMMKLKPSTDPEIKKLTLAQEIDSTKNGKGKMPSFKDKLTDDQIKDAVTYFRSLK